MPRETLTPQQQRFVDAYLISLNATQAYREAGYRGTEKCGGNQAASRSVKKC